LPDLSSIPVEFLTEIRQDQVYETIFRELQKKLPHRTRATLPPEQKPRSLHQLAVVDDETSTANEIFSSVSSENAASSQDGYDTDIESGSILLECE
jgi:hypothetical protein